MLLFVTDDHGHRDLALSLPRLTPAPPQFPSPARSYSTHDCSKCANCAVGFVNSAGVCLAACASGYYNAGGGTCAKCQPYCDACTSPTVCTTCQVTPKKYYLVSGKCVIPCTLPASFAAHMVGNPDGASSFACEEGEVLAEGDDCDIACASGYYVNNGGTTK